MSIRSLLYALARLMGDLNAIQRGPNAMFKRVVRKAALRTTSRAVNKLFK